MAYCKLTDLEKEEKVKKICEEIIGGKQLVTACKEVGIDSTEFYKMLMINPRFSEVYAHARQCQAHYAYQQALDVIEQFKNAKYSDFGSPQEAHYENTKKDRLINNYLKIAGIANKRDYNPNFREEQTQQAITIINNSGMDLAVKEVKRVEIGEKDQPGSTTLIGEAGGGKGKDTV